MEFKIFIALIFKLTKTMEDDRTMILKQHNTYLLLYLHLNLVSETDCVLNSDALRNGHMHRTLDRLENRAIG